MSLETKAFGLRARRSDRISGTPILARIPVAAAYGTAIYAGDPVKMNAGYAEKATATDATVIQGVVRQVGYVDSTGTPVLGKILPASTTSAGTYEGFATAFVDVEPSTLAEFEILTPSASSLTIADVGKYFALTLGTADSVLGLSGVTMDASSGSTSATSKVVEFLGLVQEAGNNYGDATIKARVRFIRTPNN